MNHIQKKSIALIGIFLIGIIIPISDVYSSNKTKRGPSSRKHKSNKLRRHRVTSNGVKWIINNDIQQNGEPEPDFTEILNPDISNIED